MKEVRGLYIHIPFCDGKCTYCAFASIRYAPELADRFLTALAREWDERSPNGNARTFTTLYIGGGTPTLLGPDGLTRLGTIIGERLDTSAIEEWTVEGAPATLTPDVVDAVKTMGATRISIGAQSFDDQVLAHLGRRHTGQDIRLTLKRARQAGFEDVGLDLIASLPGLTRAQWGRDLEEAVACNPVHVSVYDLSVEAGTPLAESIAGGGTGLLDDDARLERLALAADSLTGAGFEQYEISNFAKPGFRCRHNVECWEGHDYLGLGPSASSRLGPRRRTNTGNTEDYLAVWGSCPRGVATAGAEDDDEHLSPWEDAIERLLFAVRLREGLALERLERLPASLPSPLPPWRPILDELHTYDLIEVASTAIRLTPRGRAMADYVIRELMGIVEP